MIRTAVAMSIVAFVYVSIGSPTRISAQARDSGALQKGPVMTHHASGTFEVKLNPLPTEDKTEGTTLGRMAIDKLFHGDLNGKSKGEMLTVGTSVKGSAGYVAIEKV